MRVCVATGGETRQDVGIPGDEQQDDELTRWAGQAPEYLGRRWIEYLGGAGTLMWASRSRSYGAAPLLLHVCVCVSVAVPERSLRQRGGIVYVGLLWDVGLCWFWGRTGCPQGGGTAFTGLYPAAGPEGPSWSGSRACACVGCGGACVSKPPSTNFLFVFACPLRLVLSQLRYDR
jgi:hypothetical protein